MSGRFVRTVLFAAAILALPLAGYAQEAVLTGTVSDSTGGVLPGVTVVAVLEATGNRFEAVTDEAGIYRIPVRVGVYTVTAELQGFAHQSRDRAAVARRPDRDDQPADGAVHRAGNRHRHRGSAAAERVDVGAGRQRRSAPGAGATGQRPQLDGAGAARARQPDVLDQCHLTAARPQRRRGPRVPDQPRRHAGDQQPRRRRPAALQPGDDRGVPVHLEPLRRDAGPIARACR